MSDSLVKVKNYFLGCRICRKIILATTSCVEMTDVFDEGNNCLSYSEAFEACLGIQGIEASELPKRLCNDCASKLVNSYKLRLEALESDKILRSYSEMEESENALYEAEVCDGIEYVEYETLEEFDNEEDIENEDEVRAASGDDADDAVAFLTGILKPNSKKDLKTKKKYSVKARMVSEGDSLSKKDQESDRKHVCNVCGKKFQKRSNLIDHLRLHANVKVYSCEFCERSFVQAGNYKAHLRVHTKEKPFSCNDCGKSYSQSSSLKIHIRSHTQERNYICDTCEKGFTNASDLAKHKLIHNPEKKFKCDECQRSFTQKVHLRKHCEKHHPDLLFEIDNTTTFIIQSS